MCVRSFVSVGFGLCCMVLWYVLSPPTHKVSFFEKNHAYSPRPFSPLHLSLIPACTLRLCSRTGVGTRVLVRSETSSSSAGFDPSPPHKHIELVKPFTPRINTTVVIK